MIGLVVLLALALIPTAYGCNYDTRTPASCCFEPKAADPSMIFSEVILLTTSATRIIKVFHSSSRFVKKWTRTKPGALWRKLLDTNHRLIHARKSGILRVVLILFHRLNVVLLVTVRMLIDIAESLLWEVS